MSDATDIHVRQSRKPMGWQYLSVTEETPNDLWMEIAALLEPPDILALQCTCRALNQALYRKSVWAVALRQVCREHSLFLPTFPIDKMDTRQLFIAAMGPYRFRSLIESAGSFAAHADDAPVLSPAREPFASHKMTVIPQPASYLVPGGRFLLTFDCRAFILWDLGLVGSAKDINGPARGMIHTFPPGTFVFVEFETDCISMGVSMRQDSLRVVVSGNGGSGRVTLKAFEIGHFNETGQGCALRHLGELVLDCASNVKQIVIEGDRAIFESTEMVVWDFISGLYIVVKRASDINFSSSPTELEKIYIYNTLIQLGENSLKITDVPPDFVLTFGKPVPTGAPVSLRTAEQLVLPTSHTIQYPPPDDIVDRTRLRKSVANRHQARLPLLFDVYRPYRSGYTGMMRLAFTFARTPLGEIVLSPLKCIAKRAFPAGHNFAASNNPASLHVPGGFTAPLVRTISKEFFPFAYLENGLPRDEREYIYSTVGVDEKFNMCSRPECRKKESVKGTYQFCSGCHLVCYCSAQCQEAHSWPHMQVCEEQRRCTASGPIAPPMRLVKLPSQYPHTSLKNIGMCAGSGRMVNSLATGMDYHGHFSGVVLISDFLA
ncbi:hypothetical protein D9611_003491 [Ephemerocybe angulata]|uniref:F-box domain-containing protein n=1 Tax=Ephemerocybe angulata TaxID=980116 RepID=A0A8H5B666_9AGAR|nr:hypothetical protein D9611_003491 [Tulosesus angulatus]